VGLHADPIFAYPYPEPNESQLKSARDADLIIPGIEVGVERGPSVVSRGAFARTMFLLDRRITMAAHLTVSGVSVNDSEWLCYAILTIIRTDP